MFTLLTWEGVNILYIHYCTGCSDNLMFYVFYSWNGKLTERLAQGHSGFPKLGELIAMTYVCSHLSPLGL